ncbi:MAG: protein translocase subunit SecF [Gemmatimonadetes bacterium]|uniref:Protein-export membrane protein SecF n=1 Tax=Candidatus Kutchimonas denitrificans TaxID=3056748 RepID=A0AAE5CCJ3_9BACT|nr:protein translocase subunit SecF [Gemmatimonadota bacterium]NIR76023.1 protein translocase subunit SecF [Candidatus Kutchimonas denitrificans]NIS02215.1 protein translocase subunit SecF [Gemmatimonadota bacterium]NIT68041.1 protein translocase subunit SecF [Gemmatimonadota bacterium]NIU54067.1 protein translocase subunit SecF [Gemmatimonadota bacterium]
MRLFAHANYKFLEQRTKAYWISAALVILGVLSIGIHGGLNYGVDFTGGTLFQVRFNEEVAASEIREALDAAQMTGAQVQDFGGEDEFLIRTAEFLEGERELADRVDRTLTDRFGAGSYDVVRVEAVGPKVGGELRQRAVGAVLISFVLTLLYLGFRFEWRFGLAAIIATVHDVLITFGAISILNIEISLPTVAAILTIIGYSLNDTIIIFDRIRENLKKHRRMKYIEILDLSINETLPRTVMTSGTTLAVLLALAVFGGAVIREFTIVLIIGVLIGTYSSIFVASPALLEVEQRSGGVRSKTDKRKIATASADS